MKSDEKYIRHTIHSTITANESTRCYLSIEKSLGQGEVIVEKKISKRMPQCDIAKAERIYQKLTADGLMSFDIDDLLEHLERCERQAR